MILGKISSISNGNGLALVIDGESTPTTKKYKFLSSYYPTVNDRVLIEEIGDSYVVLGKLIDSTASVTKYPKASTADTATTATNATNAENATNADNATNAINAKKATTANYIKAYSDGGANISFTYFQYELWVKVGDTQWKLARG